MVTDEFGQFVGGGAVLAIAVAGAFFPADQGSVSGIGVAPGLDGVVDLGELVEGWIGWFVVFFK